jgi:hypothetical protein
LRRSVKQHFFASTFCVAGLRRFVRIMRFPVSIVSQFDSQTRKKNFARRLVKRRGKCIRPPSRRTRPFARAFAVIR